VREDPLGLLEILFDQMPMGIAISDRDFNLLRFNPTLVDFITRYSRVPAAAILPGASFFDLLPQTEPVLRPLLTRVLDGETIRQEALPLVVNAHESYWDLVFTPIRDGVAIIGLLSVVIDATERTLAQRRLEQRVEERTRELTSLLEVAEATSSTLELSSLLGVILDQLQVVADYTGAAILIEDGEDLLTLDARWAGARLDEHVGTRIPKDRIGWWEAFEQRRKPVIIADIRGAEPEARAYRRVLGEALETEPYRQYRSWLGVPLVLKDRAIGMLALTHTKPGSYTPQHGRLALAVAGRAAIAIENARLYEQAQRAAALEERQRLARELHDSVTQTIFSMTLLGDAIPHLIERDPARARERTERLNELARGALAEMRALIIELRPESLEVDGLVGSLNKQVTALRDRHQLHVVAALGDEPDLPLEVKHDLYRIAREALHNVVKHANASHVELRLAHEDGGVVLEVRDDGTGFDPAVVPHTRMGLRSMRERVAQLGGRIEIDSAPGMGSRVRVVLAR
jgi:signal transduction histidine kinase